MRPSFVPVVAATALLLAGCSPDMQQNITAPDLSPSFSSAGETRTFVITGKNGSLPASLDAQVTLAGGTLVGMHPEIGIAFASSTSGDFDARVAAHSGIESVVADMEVSWILPGEEPAPVASIDAEGFTGSAESSLGDDETFWSFQWAPQAIQAPQAWAAGYTGRGVRVAILDGGIYSSHLDLVNNIDVARSRSFTTGAWNSDVGTFWHGTHVAGIVAAGDNGIGTMGVAPNATIIGVKVLHNGTGPFAGIINGIMYAATPIEEGGAGADVINMSLGAQITVTDANRAGVRALKKSVDLATEYAYKRGVTVVVSSGNNGNNFDLNKTLFKTPAENDFALGVSSTGPIGWARGATNFDFPAYYSDYGKSLVEVAAPGGNAGLYVVNRDLGVCTVTGTLRTITNYCYVFDMVMSTVRGGTTASYGWAQGTSMAAPATAGVVALMMERHGRLTPAQVKAKLRQSSLDRGKPGNDEFYGHGWVNALNAIQ